MSPTKGVKRGPYRKGIRRRRPYNKVRSDKGHKHQTRINLCNLKQGCTKLTSLNTSGYLGVSFIMVGPHGPDWRFKASVRAWNQRIHIGFYTDAVDAAIARDLYVYDILRPIGSSHTTNVELGLLDPWKVIPLITNRPVVIAGILVEDPPEPPASPIHIPESNYIDEMDRITELLQPLPVYNDDLPSWNDIAWELDFS